MTESSPTPAAEATASTRPRPVYVPAVGPRLKPILMVVAVLLALLYANSAYLGAIRLMEWTSGHVYQNFYYQLMFLAHLVLGLLLIAPFLVFALAHLANTRHRKNRRAVRVGYVLFGVSLVVLLSGVLLLQIDGFSIPHPTARSVLYWAHVVSPIAAVWLYVLHRLAGPKLRWKIAVYYGGAVAALVLFMTSLHSQDPRRWNVAGPAEGAKYFEPSLARTATGVFIPAQTLMMDDYCKKCHEDAHRQWEQSAHHLSSFNNPAYLTSVRETRQVSMDRLGTVKSSRWCAGCHDPVPFFSGAFDDPKFDDVNHPTAHAGITCTTCHAITHVNSNRGNADYTIEEPIHYPFAFSDNPVLQWVNQQLVKAKPDFHKKTFLKPLHKDAEFCSVCHKVHLPAEVTGYKEFLRGQNHYDAWLLSGVSGHGAKSFYYPEVAQSNCNGCHMPLVESRDFGAKFFDKSGKQTIHNHLFPGANTGLAWLKHYPEAEAVHTKFLQECMRVDIFALKRDGAVDGELIGPIRPQLPALTPGKRYLVETVVRTLKLGHLLTQGTADSNEVWLEFTVRAGERIIGHSGAIDDTGEVDRWAHFVKAFVLDKEGNRINRRNAQDIRAPLYNNQIPPGAGQTVHYAFTVPEDAAAPITVEVKLQYRKFDQEYMAIIAERRQANDLPLRGQVPGEPYRNPLPIVTLAADTVTLPLAAAEGGLPAAAPVADPRNIPMWQRWNDYGIGLLLKGKAELLQAEHAFTQVEALGRFDGPLNLARVYVIEGRLDDAVAALGRAAAHQDPPPPPWTLAWLSGVVNAQQLHLEAAAEDFRTVLAAKVPERGFDFSRDYTVNNELGLTLFRLAQQRRDAADPRKLELLRESAAVYERTLTLDSENASAHYNLSLIYRQLGDTEKADRHHQLHQRYKEDETIAGAAVPKARAKYPAADHAAEALVIYDLQRSAEP